MVEDCIGNAAVPGPNPGTSSIFVFGTRRIKYASRTEEQGFCIRLKHASGLILRRTKHTDKQNKKELSDFMSEGSFSLGRNSFEFHFLFIDKQNRLKVFYFVIDIGARTKYF